MTLQELADRLGFNPEANLCKAYPKHRIVPVSCFGAESTAPLFQLDDYIVISCTGGAYWLFPKGGEA